MLSFEEKVLTLKSILYKINNNYVDSFKTDIIFYFDEFANAQENDIRYYFLKNLTSKNEIENKINNLISFIILKFNEDEEQLSDFIFIYLS